MKNSAKYKRLSKRFTAFGGLGCWLMAASFVFFVIRFANTFQSTATFDLIYLSIFIVWLIIITIMFRLRARFQAKYLAERTNEIGLQEIANASMNVTVFEPVKALSAQKLIDFNALFPGTISGKAEVYGSYLIRGTCQDKSVEMSSVKMIYTQNTAGRPEETYFNGTLVILDTRDISGLQYLFRQSETSNYKRYLLNESGMKKVQPSDIGNYWECYSLDQACAASFIDRHANWISAVTRKSYVRFVIHSYSYVLVGIEEQLYIDNPDNQFVRKHFKEALEKILKDCVESFE